MDEVREPALGDVVIERMDEGAHRGATRGAADREDQWRVTSLSARIPDAVVLGKPAAIDAALSRVEGTAGKLWVREHPDDDPVPFNPAGA
jgi:hypothetical protein